MSGFTYFTKDSLEQLRQELQKLKTVERQAASKAIAEAREKGDLWEKQRSSGRIRFFTVPSCC